MAKYLIPRSDSVSVKTIEPSDTEKLFDEIHGDFIASGLTVTAGSGLACQISSGFAKVKGLVCENTATETITNLTGNDVTYVYITIARDGNSEGESFSFTKNLTGTTPADSFKIASVTCDGSSVTAVSQSTPDITKRYAILPTGTINLYGGQYNNIPSGWLLCDGTAVSRTTYAELYDVVGDQFGAGNGSSTFNLPNLQAKFPRGAAASTNPGGTGGADTHTLTTAEMPSHGHSHSHAYNQPSGNTDILRSTPGANVDYNVGSSSTQTDVDATATGGGGAHNNIPSYQAILYIIRI